MVSRFSSTLLIPLNQGFAVRYLLHSDVFRELLDRGHRIVLLVPDPNDPYLKKYLRGDQVVLARYEMEACAAYYARSRVARSLQLMRRFILNERGGDIRTIDDIYLSYLKDNERRFTGSLAGRLKASAIRGFIRLTRNSRLARRAIRGIEESFLSPPIHAAVFERYRPDAVVTVSLGTFDYDELILREARRRGVETIAVILSWDNTTTRGYPGSSIDHVITWTEAMKEECVLLNDVPAETIQVGGVAHFDLYYRPGTFLSDEELARRLGLDLSRKTLFFATKSPNGYPCNAQIVRTLLEAIRDGRIAEPAQVVVRLHPIYFKRRDGKFVFDYFLNEFSELKREFPDLVVNEPEMVSEGFNFSMPEEEIRLLATLLRRSSVVVNMFSTINLEAAIFDAPIVNVSFQSDVHLGKKKARYDISIDEAQTHNQRVIQTGGVKMVYDDVSLVAEVNRALRDPSFGREGRAKIRSQEVGPAPGEAGKRIAQLISSACGATAPRAASSLAEPARTAESS